MTLLDQITIAVSIVGGLVSVAAAVLSRPEPASGHGDMLVVTLEDGEGNRVRRRVRAPRSPHDLRTVLDEMIRRLA